MEQEDKQLLLKDLCARIPYKPKVKVLHVWNEEKEIEEDIMDTVYCVLPDGYINTETIDSDIPFNNVILYLRSMSSMTEEENKEFQQVIEIELKALDGPGGHTIESAASSAFQIDFYNKYHFDYRGLIPMGLALEAPEGMYKTE